MRCVCSQEWQSLNLLFFGPFRMWPSEIAWKPRQNHTVCLYKSKTHWTHYYYHTLNKGLTLQQGCRTSNNQQLVDSNLTHDNIRVDTASMYNTKLSTTCMIRNVCFLIYDVVGLEWSVYRMIHCLYVLKSWTRHSLCLKSMIDCCLTCIEMFYDLKYKNIHHTLHGLIYKPLHPHGFHPKTGSLFCLRSWSQYQQSTKGLFHTKRFGFWTTR